MTFDWINDPAQWKQNIPAPSVSPSFVADLTRIGGADSKGRPNFRLVWGQDLQTSRVYSRYKDDWFPRYWYRTVRNRKIIENPALMVAPVVDFYDKIGIPRFFIETRLDLNVFYATGTQSGVDSDGEVYRAARVEEDSSWWTFLELAEVGDRCCAYADILTSNCHHLFTLPQDKHLAAVAAYRRWFEAQTDIDPTKPVTADFKAKVYRQMRDAEQKNREKLEEELDYSTRHFLNTHFHRLSDDPTVAAKGKYHFLSK